MFYQKKYTTDGANLRLEFGFVPNKVTVENLTTGNIMEWSDEYPIGESKLIVGSTGVRSTAVKGILPTEKANLNTVSLGASGVIIPVDITVTGTVAITTGSPSVVGTGTNFTSLEVGDKVHIDGNDYIVDAIADDTNLTLASNALTTDASATLGSDGVNGLASQELIVCAYRNQDK